MGGIKVHGTILSPSVLRVFAILNEKDLESEFVPVNMRAGDNKKEAFLALNPFGQIPAFEDGDLKLFDSRAISRYIAHTYAEKGNKLTFPEDPKKMGFMFAWMEVEAHKFDPVASKLVFEICVKPILGMATDEAIAVENEKKLGEVLDMYEARLKQSKYLGGDIFTLADLHHVPAVSYLMGSKIRKVFDERPHVSAWAADMVSRPAWRKVLLMQKRIMNKL